MPRLIWREHNERFGPSTSRGYLGKWRVFSVTYNLSGTRRAPVEGVVRNYDLNVFLPGLKNEGWHFATPEEAKSWAEKMVEHWAKQAGLDWPTQA